MTSPRVLGWRVGSNPPGYLIVGAPNGVAGLDADGQLPVGQAPVGAVLQIVYVGTGGKANDANSGLTVTAAKATLAAAITALGGNPGLVVLGAGTFNASGLSSIPRGSRICGVGIGGPSQSLPATVINLNVDGGTLLSSLNNVTIEHVALTFDSAVSSGILVDLENNFNNHFNDVIFKGGWVSTSHGTKIGQVGVKFATNAGDNQFTNFLFSGLGIGCDIYSQTNNFSHGKFADCATHVRGGDASGVSFSAGAAFSHVTWSGVGDYYVNLEGSSQSWIFQSGCWWDGNADTAIQVGNANGGPAEVVLTGIPQLAGVTNGLKVDRCAAVVLGGIRFGSGTTNPLLIDATNALYGIAFGLRGGGFQFSDATFPASWTYIGRDHLRLPSSVTGTPAFGSLNTGSLTNTGYSIVNRHAPTATYTMTSTDYYLPFSTTTSACALTLLSSATVGVRELIVKDRSGNAPTNNITITPDGTDTIDGAANYVISAKYGFVKLVSNGAGNWEVVGQSRQGAARALYKVTGASMSPSATADTYGTAVNLVPDSGYVGLVPNAITWTGGGGGIAGETMTVQLTATFSDASTATSTLATLAGNSTAISPGSDSTKMGLFKDGVYITKIACQIKSSGASSAGSGVVRIGGQNVA